jgi:phosphate:Na+ symporter
MNFGIFEFLSLIGALGFFIFGMKVMSEGIQKVAGRQMRQVLSVMTSNRFLGVLSGFFTTTLVQSSSATTVMIVSFVNAGLLNLRQAIVVIMGANIGTTMTVWMIALFGFSTFDISLYTLPIIAFGLPLLFIRNKNLNNWAEFIIGFALLFMGLAALKGAIPEVSNEMLLSIQSITEMGVLSIVLFILLGSIFTFVLQSSSAAMALTLVLCQNGLPFELGAAIVLGENIGTTITANLAALIGNLSAKRAARAHFIFNTFGVIWMLLFFAPFLQLVSWILIQFNVGSPFDYANESSIVFGLALFHTLFNLINMFLLIGLVDFMERIVIKMVPSRGDEATFHLEYISTGLMGTPELSLLEAYKETSRFGAITAKMNGMVRNLLEQTDGKERARLAEKIKKYEDITDRVEVEISTYLSKLSEGEISIRTSQKVRSLLSIASDLERIGDLYYQMSKVLERKNKDKIYFLPEQRENLKHLFSLLEQALEIMVQNLSTESDKVDLAAALSVENEINEFRDKLRKKHLKGVEKGEYSMKSGLFYSDLFQYAEKVGDHVINISEAYTGKV